MRLMLSHRCGGNRFHTVGPTLCPAVPHCAGGTSAVRSVVRGDDRLSPN